MYECMQNDTEMANYKLVPYEAPTWATKLIGIPQYKVKLAMLGTPIHPCLSDLPHGFSVQVKRDDMTGCTLSGNKVRMLEILMADAINKGCTHVIDCGEDQSNQCRALAIAAAQLKMTCHLFLHPKDETSTDLGCRGNLLLNRMAGAHMYVSSDKASIPQRMEALKQKTCNETGETSYIIPVFGHIGVFGYLDLFAELERQGALENYDDIVIACASGISVAGLGIGNFLTGSKVTVHGVVVGPPGEYDVRARMNDILQVVGLTDVSSNYLVDYIDGYRTLSKEQLELMVKISVDTGILLDPVYTSKAIMVLLQEVKTHPARFKGKRLLYIHTGGVIGLHDGRIDDFLKSNAASNRIH